MQSRVNKRSKNLGADEKKGIYTIFYPGIISTESQVTKYIKHKVTATTGEDMVCAGRNNLDPIDVIINPFIGDEINDVDTQPYKEFGSYFNPVKLVSTLISGFTNWYNGIHILDSDSPVLGKKGSIKNNAFNISEISLGQETDIESHYRNYQLWKADKPDNDLILWGVSRGAAATFNAYAKYKYREVKLVVLEGCFYSMEDVISTWVPTAISNIINNGLSFFTKYHNDGPSPQKNINEFPANVPVVFITSEIDKVVPCSSTVKLANELASKRQNEVYLLKLKRSSHPNYMFDDAEDRDNYEAFIHAIYERYHFPHNPALAQKGRTRLDECLIRVPYTYSDSENQSSSLDYNRESMFVR